MVDLLMLAMLALALAAPVAPAVPRAEVPFVTIVAVTERHGNRVSLTVLNDQTLQPVKRLYPADTGVLPAIGIIDASTQITEGCAPPSNVKLISGRIAKIYGYKPRGSSVVKIFRVEVLRQINGGPGLRALTP